MKIIIPRRDFLKKASELVGAIGLGFVFLPISSCENDWTIPPKLEGKTIEIDLNNQTSDILNLPVLNFLGAGFTKQFDFLNYGIPIIIVRLKKENKSDDFVCFSGLCTHDHCYGKDKVRPPYKIETANNQRICRVVCNCHGSEFNLLDNGRAIKGPAEKPLKQFQCSFDPEKNTLTIYY